MRQTLEKNIETNHRTLAIPFGNEIVQCNISEGDQLQPDFTVLVDDFSDQEEIKKETVKILYQKFWHLLPQYQNENLRQKFEISLDENTKVTIYDFRESRSETDIEEIGKVLHRYYHTLKDKSDWNLPSIQIRSKDKPNPVSGEPYIGITIGDNRVEIFPATFAKGKYRDELNCTWLEGAVAHEPTHAGIERTKLVQEWMIEGNPFGWRQVEDARISLPGGETTNWYCDRYEDCPTGYGSLLPREDIAESVVAYLYDQSRLDKTRLEMLSKYFHPVEEIKEGPPTITEESSLLPKTPTITIKLSERYRFSGKTNERNIPTILVEEYRKLRKGI